MGNVKSVAAGLYLGIAAIGLTSISAQETSAALIGVDLAEISGSDTFLTRDTGTGLDWLDVDLTRAISYDSILAGTTITNGGALQGLNPITGTTFAANPFRHATSAELLTLFTNAGIPNIDVPTVFFEANFNPIASLMTLVGTTFGAGGFQPITSGFQADASTSIAGYQNVGNLRNCNSTLSLCTGSDGLDFQSGRALITFAAAPPSQASIANGHWLVRTSSATIPEPSTWALMLAGLAGLSFARRKPAA